MPSEIIVEFPIPLTDREKKMIYGYKGEVVRCKDCVYYNAMEGFCEYLSNNYAPAVDMEEDDFCSKGKRKDE